MTSSGVCLVRWGATAILMILFAGAATACGGPERSAQPLRSYTADAADRSVAVSYWLGCQRADGSDVEVSAKAVTVTVHVLNLTGSCDAIQMGATEEVTLQSALGSRAVLDGSFSDPRRAPLTGCRRAADGRGPGALRKVSLTYIVEPC